MSSQAKRMQLTRDQRAVLEAVYAIEKLPDASLRERLASYLNLTARQIQVRCSPLRAAAGGARRAQDAPGPTHITWCRDSRLGLAFAGGRGCVGTDGHRWATGCLLMRARGRVC